jgi:hypothetical protein
MIIPAELKHKPVAIPEGYDRAMLVGRARLFFLTRYHTGREKYPRYPILDTIGLRGCAMNVAVSTDNVRIDGHTELFDECLHKDDEIFGKRRDVLYTLNKK